MTDARDLDKFYTDSKLATLLIGVACSSLGLPAATAFMDDPDGRFGKPQFVEPSAGSGAFSSQIPGCLAYDIAPEGDGIEQADFLDTEPSWPRSSVAIGNPPFGRRASLAVSFVNRCASSCDAVAMVLPNTFRRYNTQSRLSDELALIEDINLPEHGSFSFEGSPYSLRCVFQVWVRKDGAYWHEGMSDMRIRRRPPTSHPDFECWQHNATEESRRYVDEDWELAFWRQGYKDYTRVFHNPEDYDEVRDIVYGTNLQLFFVRPLSDEARDRILRMDIAALASSNLSTPGFGKGDFVAEYMRLRKEDEERLGDAGNGMSEELPA